MKSLEYTQTTRLYQGVIKAIESGSVTIDILGRLGTIMLAKRLLICDEPLQVGQIVGFMMSYPEVIEAVPQKHYVENFKREALLMAKLAREKEIKKEDD